MSRPAWARAAAPPSDGSAAHARRARSRTTSAEWPFVEVPDRGPDRQRVEGAGRADAQQNLLGEPRASLRDVQLVGDPSIVGLVAFDVRVEQEERHPADLGDPHREPDRAPRQVHGDLERTAVRPRRPAERQVSRIDVRLEVLLPAIGIDPLAEVAAVVEGAHPDHRQAGHRTPP